VFSKRYEMYEAARKSITLAFEKSDENDMPTDLDELFFKFEEARFFFPNEIPLFLDTLRKDIKTFLALNYAHRQNKAQIDTTQSVEYRKTLLDEETNILKLREALYSTRMSLPKIFGGVLDSNEVDRWPFQLASLLLSTVAAQSKRLRKRQ